MTLTQRNRTTPNMQNAKASPFLCLESISNASSDLTDMLINAVSCVSADDVSRNRHTARSIAAGRAAGLTFHKGACLRLLLRHHTSSGVVYLRDRSARGRRSFHGSLTKRAVFACKNRPTGEPSAGERFERFQGGVSFMADEGALSIGS